MVDHTKKKRISTTFNANQITYLGQLAKMEGVTMTTFVTDLSMQAIRDAIKDGRLPVNLPSLEERHKIMCKFIRFFYLADQSDDIAEDDRLTEMELEYVSNAIGVSLDDLKATFFDVNLTQENSTSDKSS